MAATPIDLEHLARYTGGEKDLNGEILRLFDGQVTGMVAELNALLASRDSKRWREIAHTIKGAARGVGRLSRWAKPPPRRAGRSRRRRRSQGRDPEAGTRSPDRARFYPDLSGGLSTTNHQRTEAFFPRMAKPLAGEDVCAAAA